LLPPDRNITGKRVIEMIALSHYPADSRQRISACGSLTFGGALAEQERVPSIDHLGGTAPVSNTGRHGPGYQGFIGIGISVTL
jgi:hypothetical protein